MKEEEKKVESLEEKKDSVETLEGNKVEGMQPLKKGTVVFLIVFLVSLGLFVGFLPNISNFIASIGEEDVEKVEEQEEVDETDNDLVELEDIDVATLNTEVTGQIICVKTKNTGLFASDIAYGYDFVDDELVTVNEYYRLRYSDPDTFDIAKTFAESTETAYNAVDGIIGTTTLGTSSIIDEYKYDLTIFDYTTEILIDEEDTNRLEFTSLSKADVVDDAEENEFTCTGDLEEE